MAAQILAREGVRAWNISGGLWSWQEQRLPIEQGQVEVGKYLPEEETP